MSHFRSFEEKYIPPEHLEDKVALLRKEQKKIATLNGSFDLLHAGHLEILRQAAHQAEVLIVALNSDDYLTAHKGSNRPIVPLQFRLQLIAALEMVDFVTWFTEENPCRLIADIKPDVHVNGREYGENCVEAQIVAQVGARLHLVDRIEGLATSQIIGKIRCD